MYMVFQTKVMMFTWLWVCLILTLRVSPISNVLVALSYMGHGRQFQHVPAY